LARIFGAGRCIILEIISLKLPPIHFHFADRVSNPFYSHGGDSASSLLASQSGVSVGDLNVELQGSLDDGLAGAETNGGTDLSGVLSVVNEKEFELLDVVNGELEESRGQLVSGCASSLVTDVGHQLSALVLPSDSVVNSTGLSPGFPDTHEAVGLKASEFVDDFLDLLCSINRSRHLGMI